MPRASTLFQILAWTAASVGCSAPEHNEQESREVSGSISAPRQLVLMNGKSFNLEVVSASGEGSFEAQLYLEIYATPENLSEVTIDRFNLALAHVNQGLMLSGSDRVGSWGATLTDPGKALSYEPESARISGELPILVHYDVVDDVLPPSFAGSDYTAPATLPGEVQLVVELEDSLEEETSAEKYTGTAVLKNLTITIVGLDDLLGHHVLLENEPEIAVERAFEPHFEVKPWIRLQPISFTDGTMSSTTGADFFSLFANAELVWGKAGVGLQPLPPIVISDQQHYSAAVRCDTTDLRFAATANLLFDWNIHPFAAEVFFCGSFEDYDWDGGGHTYGMGRPAARVILTDDITPSMNANILGHEIGHVLDIYHPYDPQHPGSHGTVMCTGSIPSMPGSLVYLDAPDKNSDNNMRLVNNSMMFGSLVRAPNAHTDCMHGDCGGCP